MASKDEGVSLWTVAKIVLFTAGAIYLVSLLTWFAHWATMLAAVGGAGYLAWTIARATSAKKVPKQLTSERPFEQRMRQLEAEERLLDRKIGI